MIICDWSGDTEAFWEADVERFLKKGILDINRESCCGAVCDVGFFKLSRHPNYFAEIMTQVCMYTPAISDFIVSQS